MVLAPSGFTLSPKRTTSPPTPPSWPGPFKSDEPHDPALITQTDPATKSDKQRETRIATGSFHMARSARIHMARSARIQRTICRMKGQATYLPTPPTLTHHLFG